MAAEIEAIYGVRKMFEQDWNEVNTMKVERPVKGKSEICQHYVNDLRA